MGKVLNFENNEDMPNFMIEIERSEEFDNAAKELSAFVLSLPLSHEDNDKLPYLVDFYRLEDDQVLCRLAGITCKSHLDQRQPRG